MTKKTPHNKDVTQIVAQTFAIIIQIFHPQLEYNMNLM
jgi:hypothetical protein